MKRLTHLAIAIALLLGIGLTFTTCTKEEQNQDPEDNIIPQLNEYVLNDNVVVIDSTVKPIIDGDKYTFNFTNEPPDIKVGDIIVGQADGGFIKKVISIESSEKSTGFILIFILGQALFEEVFDDCNFDINVPLYSGEQSLDETVLFDEGIEGVDLEIGIEEGSIDTELILNFKLQRLDGVTLLFSISANGDIDFNALAQLVVSGELEYDDEIPILTPFTFPFWIGPVPAQFYLGFYGGFSLAIDAEADISYSCEANAGVEFGAQYTITDDWEEIWTPYAGFDNNGVDWDLTVESSAEIYVKPEIKLLIAGVVGPTINARPFLNLEANVNYPDWMWQLNGGLNGDLGFELSVFRFYNIVDFNVPLVEWQNTFASDEGTVSNEETFTDSRDGQTYKIVDIGDQTWFAENLNYQTNDSWWYDNSSTNGDLYGRLYLWNAALNACPNGWHLPSDNEWKTLELHLGMSQEDADYWGSWRGTDEGKKLKSKTGWVNNGNGIDEVGFNALPAGFKDPDKFTTSTVSAWFWTATQVGSTEAKNRMMQFDGDQIAAFHVPNIQGYSVRCLKD